MSKNCSQKATTRPQNETKRVEQNAHDTLYREKRRERRRREAKRREEKIGMLVGGITTW